MHIIPDTSDQKVYFDCVLNNIVYFVYIYQLECIMQILS